jgi:hypothetical protein
MTLRNLAASDPRMETGPLQFGGDWPGVFFRGDDALSQAQAIDWALRALPDNFPSAWALRNMLSELRDTLRSCEVSEPERVP